MVLCINIELCVHVFVCVCLCVIYRIYIFFRKALKNVNLMNISDKEILKYRLF